MFDWSSLAFGIRKFRGCYTSTTTRKRFTASILQDICRWFKISWLGCSFGSLTVLSTARRLCDLKTNKTCVLIPDFIVCPTKTEPKIWICKDDARQLFHRGRHRMPVISHTRLMEGATAKKNPQKTKSSEKKTATHQRKSTANKKHIPHQHRSKTRATTTAKEK